MVDLPIDFKEIELIVLDMDGVITSEQAYWDTAGLVVRDILESPAFLGLSPPNYTPISALFYQRLVAGNRSEWRKYLPSELILTFKSRGINSNWDLAYLTLGLYLAPLFEMPLTALVSLENKNSQAGKTIQSVNPTLKQDNEESLPIDNSETIDKLAEYLAPAWDHLSEQVQNGEWPSLLRTCDFHLWGSFFRDRKRTIAPIKNIKLQIIDDFHPAVRGLRLLEELNTLLTKSAKHRWTVFGRKTELWENCRNLFQEWYLGEELYKETYNTPILYTPKPGLVHREEPLHGQNKTHACLSHLQETGFELGIATGRPLMEIMTPLSEWGMLKYFKRERIVTHDEIERTEADLKNSGIEENIGKPHPYAFLKAIHPHQNALELIKDIGPIPNAKKILIVGDAQADIWAAQKIGCPCAALLSGASGATGKKLLEEAKPDVVCQDILELVEGLIALKK